jgi:hypothetical protein
LSLLIGLDNQTHISHTSFPSPWFSETRHFNHTLNGIVVSSKFAIISPPSELESVVSITVNPSDFPLSLYSKMGF